MNKNIGTLESLTKTKLVTWEGWVIYHWDMSHCAALFDKKPKRAEWDRPNRTWEFDNAIENINVDFLIACGVDGLMMERKNFITVVIYVLNTHPSK